MSTLTEILTDPARRPAAVAELSKVVEEEVSSTSGLSGMALKTAFGAATKVKSGLVPSAVDKMLPEIAAALEPYWASKGGSGFGAHLAANGDAVADTLLAVADAKVASDGGAVAKVYNGVRPKAKGYVIDALPRLGDAIERLA